MAFFVGESYLKYPACISLSLSLDLCKKRECKKREIYEFCQYIAYRWFSLNSLQPRCSIFFVLGRFSLPPNPPQTFFENARTKLNHSLLGVRHHSFLFLKNKKNKFSFTFGGSKNGKAPAKFSDWNCRTIAPFCFFFPVFCPPSPPRPLST